MSAGAARNDMERGPECSHCGAPLDPAHTRCFHCGTPTPLGQQETRRKFIIGLVVVIIFCAVMIVWLPRVLVW